MHPFPWDSASAWLPDPEASNQLMILLAILDGTLCAPLLVYDVT